MPQRQWYCILEENWIQGLQYNNGNAMKTGDFATRTPKFSMILKKFSTYNLRAQVIITLSINRVISAFYHFPH